MRFYQFDIALVHENYYQATFLHNREKRSLQFTSDPGILPLSQQVSIDKPQKLNF